MVSQNHVWCGIVLMAVKGGPHADGLVGSVSKRKLKSAAIIDPARQGVGGNGGGSWRCANGILPGYQSYFDMHIVAKPGSPVAKIFFKKKCSIHV